MTKVMKDKQKQLLTEVMNADAKDGLYHSVDSNKMITAVEWLYNNLFPKQIDGFSCEEWNKIDKAFDQAKQMEKEREYETKAFWFGRGILACKEGRVSELKPTKDE